MALHTFHEDTPQVLKDSLNPHFGNRFASQGAIDKALQPYLAKVGLVLTQFPCVMDDGGPGLDSMLAHVSGEWLASDSPLVMDKNNSQGQGSGLTYLRRYATCAILRITADADDDANSAVGQPARAERVTRPKPSKPEPEFEEVNGEQIPLSPRMETTRSGPPSDLASPKQVGYLKSLLDNQGFSQEDIVTMVAQHCPPWPDSLRNLSKAQASTLINLVKP